MKFDTLIEMCIRDSGNVGRNPKDRMQMTVLPDDQGKHAVTHYRVLERLGYVTLVELSLIHI